MKDKLDNYFKNLDMNNKIGHAFLICNCDLSFIKDEIEIVLSNYIFNKKINLNNNEDVLIIEPENNIIKKEKVQQIHEFINTTSQTSGVKVYIIDKCDLMNDSAANSLLKVLEEPESNIYAFLISSNAQNVIKTIYSRCQILNFYNEDFSNKIIEEADKQGDLETIIKFVELLEEKKEKTIANYAFISKKIKDREFIREMFYVIVLLYRDALNIKLGKNQMYFSDYKETLNMISDKNTKDDIIIKLTLINKYIGYVDYNLNTNLLLDRFIIEVVGDNNE